MTDAALLETKLDPATRESYVAIHREDGDATRIPLPPDLSPEVAAVIGEIVKAADEELHRTRAALRACRAVVKRLEWVTSYVQGRFPMHACPVCGGLKPGTKLPVEADFDRDTGHAPSCALAKALGAGP